MNEIIKEAEQQIWHKTGHKVSLVPVYNVTLLNIIKAAKEYYGISLEALISKERHQLYQIPRKAVILIASKYNFSTTEIAKRLNRDHSSVVDALQVAEAWNEMYSWFQQDVDQVVKRIAYEGN